MKCENCQNEHDGKYGSGRFCSQKCSRSFSAKINREETNKKVSETLKNKFLNGELKISKNSHKFKTGFDPKRRIFNDDDRKKSKISLAKYRDDYLKNKPFELLCKNVRKKIIFSEQFEQCKICGIKNWMDKPLKFHLDHIDGNHYNNKKENCRIICPNCHSQTETYCRNSTKRYNDSEIINHIENSTSIHSAMKKLKMSTGRNYKRVKKLVLEKGVEPSKF